MTVEIEGVTLHLAHPDELSVRWVGQEEWDAVINVNLTGVYALIQAALPSMIEHGGGTIVTVGSVAATRPGLIGGAPYGAAKAGVLNLMGHVHTVLRDKGIRATTVMPAPRRTLREIRRSLISRLPTAARWRRAPFARPLRFV